MAGFQPVNYENINIGDVIIAEALNNPNFSYSGTVVNKTNVAVIIQLNQPGPIGGNAIGAQKILLPVYYSFYKQINNLNAAMGGGGGGQVFPNNNVNMIGARRRRRGSKSKKSKKSRKGKSRKERKH